MNRTLVALLITACFFLGFSSRAGGHGPSPHKAAEDHSMSEEAMKAQHERMEKFKEASDILSDAIIHGSGKNDSGRIRKAISTHYASADCWFVPVEGTVQVGDHKGVRVGAVLTDPTGGHRPGGGGTGPEEGCRP